MTVVFRGKGTGRAVETYEEWKLRRGITQEDERRFKEKQGGCATGHHDWLVMDSPEGPLTVCCWRCGESRAVMTKEDSFQELKRRSQP